jgi:hypothetical protein
MTTTLSPAALRVARYIATHFARGNAWKLGGGFEPFEAELIAAGVLVATGEPGRCTVGDVKKWRN